MNKKKIIAAFDFDGTITYTDTILLFFIYTVGPIKAIAVLLRSIPTFFSYLIGKTDRKAVKEALLTRFLKGRSLIEIKKSGKRFAETILPYLIRPKAKKRIAWHSQHEDRLVLVSASLDLYLEPWTKEAGFDECLTSQVAANDRGEITGKLLGPNCRGVEKVKRLKEIINDRKNWIIYAYGDSRGDREMLEFADFAFYRRMI